MTASTLPDSGANAGSARRPNPEESLRIFGMSMQQFRRSSVIVGLLIILLLPFTVEDFAVFQMTQVIYLSIAVLGLNLLTGFNGQFSLGHSAFMALGAYTAGIMMAQWEIAYYWTIIPAGVICFAAGFLFGLPALRLEGLYLALATFALATATPQLLKYEHFEPWTGGVQGLDLFKDDSPIAFLSNDQWWYYFSLFFGVLLFIGAWNLVRGRTGRAMIAIRDNPIAASTMGINTSVYKATTFGVSGFYCGVAGALSAIVVEFIAPESFTIIHAILLLIAMVIGGLASIPAAIIGGAFILYMPNFSEAVVDAFFAGDPSSKALVWVSFGVVMIIVVYIMPMGVAGFIRWNVQKLARRG
ncbi:MAG: branched-chain amino acid ABC transporter permease [Rhodospirillaceae bacterium]|jgi:branched-chain amino acid transport system permease protein|nr:branched-chain amino acid ABC transporter permease [Rhodospirillaceae bacterium]MBT4490330.1 branched-chain amino acid ABC transporter permease [Rhodospirillaceae bacterium]MBT5192399.1 branched-chain amino acid ABC transporter permease [Rhodospirillaceae bacterium]MBT5899203.1 branched-chain amino acid ABC transporter permease [Rhodospirillaceae bacterium]MBT6430915.1 branched-chain amino acid ABC transporter permease [Rhodospirillaceae bacterium]